MESYFVPHIQRIKLRRELSGLLLLNNIDSRLLPIAEHEVSAKMNIPSLLRSIKENETAYKPFSLSLYGILRTS